MMPASSVSALVFAHPKSQYFAVGQIAKDQVADYGKRKGVDLNQAEKWLSPILNYGASLLVPFLSARFFLQVLFCKPFDTLDSPAHSPKPTSRQLPQIAIKFFEWSNMATFITIAVCEKELPTQSGSRLARDTIRRLTRRLNARALDAHTTPGHLADSVTHDCDVFLLLWI